MKPATSPVPAAPVRLRLDPVMTRRGALDGGWWPYSRDAATELPLLVTALSGLGFGIRRLTVDSGDWDDHPHRTIRASRSETLAKAKNAPRSWAVRWARSRAWAPTESQKVISAQSTITDAELDRAWAREFHRRWALVRSTSPAATITTLTPCCRQVHEKAAGWALPTATAALRASKVSMNINPTAYRAIGRQMLPAPGRLC